MSYLRLIEVECNGRNVDHAVAEIEKQFWLRNSDKTIKDDGYQIEGSGDCPVKWDFRRQSLLNYLGYRQH